MRPADHPSLNGIRSGVGRFDGAERSKSGAGTCDGDGRVGGTATVNAAGVLHIGGVRNLHTWALWRVRWGSVWAGIFSMGGSANIPPRR